MVVLRSSWHEIDALLKRFTEQTIFLHAKLRNIACHQNFKMHYPKRNRMCFDHGNKNKQYSRFFMTASFEVRDHNCHFSDLTHPGPLGKLQLQRFFLIYYVLKQKEWIINLLVKSTQYKKLAPNALWFAYQNAKSICKKLKTKGMFFVSSFSCDMQGSKL